jgi:hypothetical protein
VAVLNPGEAGCSHETAIKAVRNAVFNVLRCPRKAVGGITFCHNCYKPIEITEELLLGLLKGEGVGSRTRDN